MPYAEHLPKTVPGWLRSTVGLPYFRAIGTRMDSIVQLFRDAVTSRLPGVDATGNAIAPTKALDNIGVERSLPRSTGEADNTYALRLEKAWDAWQGDNTPLTGVGGGGGSHLGMLNAIKALSLPTGPTGATIIQHNGRWAQLDNTGALVLGAGPIAVNRRDLTGAFPGNLPGFTLDARDQFYSKFAITFLANVASLRAGTVDAARLGAVAMKWKPAGSIYVGAFVIEAGGGWDWPTNQLWNDGTLWNSDTVDFIPPPA